ncbi:MAG: HAMP domain-containing histidine kinase [Rhodospirillales bacterium]|nr:HAMP domain-containing histidine kinase [Rhodospirillales bacterium]
MRPRSLLQTALFRLTLLHAAVFLGSALVLAIGGALFLSFVLESDIRSEVEAELEGLMIEFEGRGRDGATRAVEDRLADSERAGFDYLLQDRNGAVLAGTLPAVQPIEGWLEVVTPQGEADEPAIAKGIFLPDGGFLVVARDAESLYESQDFIFEALGWSFGLALPLALLGGIATSLATLRRIEAVNRATMKIRRSGLGARVPVSEVDDEFNRLAQNINAMLDGIEELTEQMRQVTNDIAHDLRTPLTRLRQDLERAKQDPRPDNTDSLIDSSIARIDEVLDTFSSLLRISQIESGSGREHFASLDLSSLCRELAETFESVAEDSGKTLACDILDGLTVFGDKPLLRQMIVNLIENAIQHTPPGATIHVELGRDKSGIHAVVADNGPGIPAWAQEKVFRRFFRLDRSRQSRGNGLGLSLVAAIAKHHGITLTLRDNHPGLRVRLDFPPLREGRAPKAIERVPA